MAETRLRRLSSGGLVAGGLTLLAWTVGGLVTSGDPGRATVGLALGSYGGIVVGLGGLGALARRRDDALAPGAVPLAVGAALLAPAVLAGPLPVRDLPLRWLWIAATGAGLCAVAVGLATLVATLLATHDSALVPQPWARAAGALATAGVFGWLLAVALGQPDPPGPVALLVTPYTAAVADAATWTATAAVAAGGVALCTLGWALDRQADRRPDPGTPPTDP